MSPYRTPSRVGDAPRPAFSFWCLFGHRWAAFKVHNALMAHLGPTAGVDARCTRCGLVSLWTGTRYDEEP